MGSDKAARSPQSSGGNQEEACLICIALRKFQLECVEDLGARMPQSLCSGHTWLVAKSADAGAAADFLLRLIGHALKEESAPLRCEMCLWMAQEENRELDEFAKKLLTPTYPEWFREHGGLCIPHARKLFDRVGREFREIIVLAVQRETMALKDELVALSRSAKAGMQTHAGVLGRAAEHLVGKRGLFFRN